MYRYVSESKEPYIARVFVRGTRTEQRRVQTTVLVYKP